MYQANKWLDDNPRGPRIWKYTEYSIKKRLLDRTKTYIVGRLLQRKNEDG